ncbi:kinase-like domain-containing protein, partial [Roridomyces roridus]
RVLILKEDGKPDTQFQLGNRLGHGHWGPVFRALNLNTGQMVAMKRIQLAELQEEQVTNLLREVDFVKKLSHPNIIKYESIVRDTDSLSIVMEHVLFLYAENGSLEQSLKAFGKFNEPLAASYSAHILEGLHYLHSNDIVHCDIKAANVLTNKNGTVKLTDFGSALNLRGMDFSIAGSPNWMAPEIIELLGPPSTKSDIWSLGCTIVEMVTGHPPYHEIGNYLSVMFRIVDDETIPLPGAYRNYRTAAAAVCFNKDPANRPDAASLSKYQWVKESWDPRKLAKVRVSFQAGRNS